MMNPLKGLLFLLLIGFPTVQAAPDLHTEEVIYSANLKDLHGYLAYDPAIEGKRPGVLVVHEWWGLNEYVRQRSRQLAELGYVALAVDMYGEGKVAKTPEEATRLSQGVNEMLPGTFGARFFSALNFLRSQPNVNPERIAAIGYCFGGGIALEMARGGLNLEGVVSFHGSLPTENPPPKGGVPAAVLVLHGESDRFVSEEQLANFKRQMEAANADFRIITYPGAEHGFTNPEADKYAEKFNLDIAYSEKADKQSWQDMKAFLERIFMQRKKVGLLR
ncbi:MAG: dienelactone hydrolase family protein [Candidatus Binatia bacterium]